MSKITSKLDKLQRVLQIRRLKARSWYCYIVATTAAVFGILYAGHSRYDLVACHFLISVTLYVGSVICDDMIQIVEREERNGPDA